MVLSTVGLKGFFKEVGTCLKAEEEKAGLVSNGRFVLSNESFVGKAYGYAFKWLNYAYGLGNDQEALVNRAFIYASHSSRVILERVSESYKNFQLIVVKRSLGKPYDEVEYAKNRFDVSDFMQNAAPLYEKLKRKKEDYARIFDRSFKGGFDPKTAEGFVDKGWLWEVPFSDRFSGILKWVFDRFKELAHGIDNLFGKPVAGPVVEQLTFEGEEADTAGRNYLLAREHQFQDGGQVQRFKELWPIIELEGALNEPFPYGELKKVFCGEQISPEDDAVLSKWVHQLCQWKHERATEYFHGALESFRKQLLTMGLSDKDLSSVAQIEYRILVSKKAEAGHLFTGEDVAHLKWVRENIITGNKIKFRNTEYEVGELFAEVGSNKYYLAKGENEEKCLLRIPQNRCIAALDLHEEEKVLRSALPYRVADIDESGHFVILRGEFKSLSGHVWYTDPEKNEVHKNDSDLFKELVDLIRGYFRTSPSLMPLGLDLNQFVVTKDNKLKSLHVLPRVPLNFWGILHFVKRAAKGNQAIYRLLCNALSFEKHTYGQLFINLVTYALKQRMGESATNPCDNEELDDETRKYAKELMNQAASSFDQCIKEISPETGLQNWKLKELNTLFLVRYRAARLIKKLPKDIVKTVVEDFKKNFPQ